MKFSTLSLARIFIFILAQAFACTAGAKDTGTDTSVTIEKDLRTYVVHEDGSFTMNYELTMLINEQRAVAAAAQRSISYNRTLEDLLVIDAYTQKPDGRRVKVQPDQIRDQQEARSAGAPMFQDTRVTAVIYPEVAVGDRIVLHFQKTRSTALFPGHFEDMQVPSFAAIKQFSVIYDMPDSLPLHADARGFQGSVTKAAPGRIRYQWDYLPAERQRIERGSVAYTDYGLRLAVSTFADFGAFAKAYDARASDKSLVTEKIRSQALKITAGMIEPRNKALALSNWVRRNIRYVAVYVGAGGIVPHAADAILDNLYGDCKDHVALLEAMLAAIGIDSSPALINLGNSYRLPTVATLGTMNHVITYIPLLNLYLDSTASPIAAGYLPIQALDKPVLLTKTGQLARTPGNQQGQIINRGEYRIKASGAADFNVNSTLRGWTAENTRYIMRSIKPADYSQAVERMLQQRGQKGTGTLELGRLTSLSDEYKMTIKGTSDNLLNLPGPVGISANATFTNDIGQFIAAITSENERTQDFICVARHYEEETQFTLPSEISMLAMPKTISVHDTNIDYTASYTRQDQLLVMRRSFEFRHQGAVCTPAEHRAMSPALEQIARDLRSQIIVQGS